MPEVNQIERKFTYKRGTVNHDLPDPNPEMTPQEVKKFYAARFAELANASVEGPVNKDNVLTFSFTTNIGTKG
jgi:PRTRC genetic system protein C